MKRYILSVLLSALTFVSLCAQHVVEEIDEVPYITETPLQKGYAYSMGMRKTIYIPTPDEQRMHIISLSDTLTIHFNLTDFYFHEFMDVTMPQRDCGIRLSLYDSADDSNRSKLLDFPFRVNGRTMRTYISDSYERQDSVIIRLAPGRYLLQYDGYDDSFRPALQQDMGRNSAAPQSTQTSMDDGPHSGITLSVECIPLIRDRETVVTSYSHVTTSRFRSSPFADDDDIQDPITIAVLYDDFGREMSTFHLGATPQHGTLADFRQYDAAGRLSREWLNISMPGLNSESDMLIAETDFSERAFEQYSDNVPYHERFYDNASVLDRTPVLYGPGEYWYESGKCVCTQYLSNSITDNRLKCQKMEVLSLARYDTTATICSHGLFPSGALKVISVTDEDGHETLSFTDNLGRTILQRQVLCGSDAVNQYLDTYYIYDGLDHLLAVVPPALSPQITADGAPAAEVHRYAYLYIYDAWERIVGKKLPGRSWTRMVYDRADRLIFSQDGRQRAMGKSTFHLYDIYGRECVNGICSKDISMGESIPSYVRAEYCGSACPLVAYDCSGITLSSTQVMKVTFYDGYDFLEEFDSGLPGDGDLYGNPIPGTTGRMTGCVRYPMSEETDYSSGVWSLVRYDDRGRTSHTETAYAGNGGYDVEDVEYNLLGSPVRRRMEHRYSQSSAPVTEMYTYSYDHAERLTEVKHSLNGGEEVILAANSYDEFGRLLSAEHGTSSDLAVQYGYNIRSWPTLISSPVFEEELYYETTREGALPGTDGMFGGSVSSMTYSSGTDSVRKSYDYGYDGLGRLAQARQMNGLRLGLHDAYYSYDVMGNILSIARGNGTPVCCTYDGNRLESSTSAPDGEYGYDANGNMTYDPVRAAVIEYNVDNLPFKISREDNMSLHVDLTYLPDGILLSRDDWTGAAQHTLTEYRGNMIYRDSAPKYLIFDGGLIDMTGSTPEYQFFIKDHLGSTRVVASASGQVLQRNEYYPYGQDIETAAAQSDQPYRFSGKELLTCNDIDLYDFGARHYDPALCRFTTMDPLAEKYYFVSPYAYCKNNPVIFVDPDGRRSFPMKEPYNGWTIKVDSWYGRRNAQEKEASEFHKGLDFNYSCGGNNDYGSPILATHEGYASVMDDISGLSGRSIVITSPDGKFRTRYMHLSSNNIVDGQYIWEGEKIGEMGGSAKGSEHFRISHLHYEIQEKINGKWMNANPVGKLENSLKNIEDPQSRISDEDKIFNGGMLPASVIVY